MLIYWIWLAECKDISLIQKHRLLMQFQDPEALYHASDAFLSHMGVSEKHRRALAEKDLRSAKRILKSCMEKEIGILPVTDDAYPEKLRHTEDAPIVLYYKGRLPDWNAVPFIGVVGTRKASAYGLQVAHQMGKQIAMHGGFLVSGGAVGGDTAAMEGALEAGCPVIGVLGCGVDIVYPRNNRRLFSAVMEDGCLLSEYPPGIQPLPWHFLERNRIISGISNGVLIVEAPKVSGALNTARHALEQGRDVFVVPGNINNPTCEGSNALLQEGAIPVFSGWDVLKEYAFLYPGKLQQYVKAPLQKVEFSNGKVAESARYPEKMTQQREISEKKPIDKQNISTYIENNSDLPAMSEKERAVLAQLTGQPQETAELIAKLDMSSSEVLSALTLLTIKGLAKKHPGGSYSLK